MLTHDQEKWIAHLADDDRVAIQPLDPNAGRIFEQVKARIQAACGSHLPVLHRGATSLGISGQDEIDVYCPVPEAEFVRWLPTLSAVFGPPRSHYPLERARFVTYEEGKHIDIFLINAACQGWLDGNEFDAYLRSHPDTLDQYRLLKESGDGLSTREYYRRKTAFINSILALTRSSCA